MGNTALVLLSILASVATLGIITRVLVYVARLRRRTRTLEDELTQAHARLQHMTMHDALTGLPNRPLLLERLAQALAQAQSVRQRFAVAVLDLDRFKSINDSLGHPAGDELLRQTAERLQAWLRHGDTLARIGGDEFVIIFRDVLERHDAEAAVRAILAVIAAPVPLAGLEIGVSASIGISLFPDDGADADSLLANADLAMHQAKSLGGGNLSFFAPALASLTRERLALESGLRRALAERQFLLEFQPQVDVPSGRIAAAEALIRWAHPERGLIGPGGFVALAEETGLIVPIGEWVLREACRAAAAWHAAGARSLCMAVNLAPQQLHQSTLLEVVRSALEESRLEARYLELELTESAVMREPEASIRVLRELSALGVRIAVDDFGTGYSSLNYLRRLPLDKLKIDRSFIREVTTSHEDAEVVRAIVSLAHSLRLRVIAEGVETAEQLLFLRTLGCDQYQGYFKSAPLRAADFLALLHASEALVELPAPGIARLRATG